jgi:hypothetical protein
MISALEALQTGQVPAGDLCREMLADRDRLLEMFARRLAEKEATIQLQAEMIESMGQRPVEKLLPGDIERLSDMATILRGDPRPIWGACIDSLERLLAGVREGQP